MTAVSSPAHQFATTDWQTAMAARSDTDTGSVALSRLCELYWYPLYGYLRRTGVDTHTAADLTQGFFEHAIETRFFQKAHKESGRLRSLLLTSFRNFVLKQHRHETAIKRGGATTTVQWDLSEAESRLLTGNVHQETAERLYERDWVLGLIERVLGQLRAEQMAAGLGARFDQLSAHLMEKESSITHADLGVQLGLTEGAVRIAIYRLRQRSQQLLRSEILKVVSSPEEVTDELRYMAGILCQ
jgi:DNA-directed RNA polymerase specialized sigma24 family protein